MNRLLYVFFTLCIAVGLQSFHGKQEQPLVKIKLVTTKGEIVLKLYDETPLHRDNFITIVKDGVLDSLLFHRVIENFMVQSGDTGSKHAKDGEELGEGELDYKVPAEFSPKLFHKKGVLAAARDDNPTRASSSTQFYLVQGKVFNDSLLDKAEGRINNWLAQYYIKQDSTYTEQYNTLLKAQEAEDWKTYERIKDKFNELAKDYTGFERYTIPEEHREIYKTIGGTPHLDQNYTVFGEIISGLEVVDSIAAVKTNDKDRPIQNVRILNALVLE